jgi:RNA polymerase sigma-70 factor, ECF subfamily
MEATDRELMGRLARGEREALDMLMERHYVRLYRIALGYMREPDDALEVVQEAFVNVFRHAPRWDPATEVAPWITRITINQAIDRYRQSRRRLSRETPLEQEDGPSPVASIAIAEPSPERRLLSRELGERMGAAVRTLPERQRAVFVLRHYEDMTLEEIGSALGMRLGTVKSSLHRALQHLRLRLAGLRGETGLVAGNGK